MILLNLKLVPSSIAKSFVLFLVLRSCSLVVAVLAVLLLPVLFGVVSVVVYALMQVGFCFYLYRLVLCVFTLAAKAAEGEGQPVGRPSLSPEWNEDGLLIL